MDAAERAATQALVNCFLREGGRGALVPLAAASADERAAAAPGDTHVAVLDAGIPVAVGIRYASVALHHRCSGPARRVGGGPLSLPALAGLLVDALGGTGTHPALLVERILASVRVVRDGLHRRADDLDRLAGRGPLRFLDAEHALLLGHPLHPTPKSRTEMAPADERRYAPETRARFQLHWLAVAPERVIHDSALPRSAPALTRALLGAGDVAPDRVLLPAHPWEAAYARRAHPALFAAGDVEDLGPRGARVAATTSLRTVCHEDWPFQLKFSLHVRVTNSLRVTLPRELRRAVEAARLQQSALGAAAARIAPDFRWVHDPAYLTVTDGTAELPAFSVLLRENPWTDQDATSLAALCQDHPGGGVSRIGALAAGRGREWWARYCEVVVRSLVRLYADAGLCFEPHAQNTVLELDADGLPARCWYRDSQGYFHRELAHADVTAVLPGHGEASESIFPEALADERLVYYCFVNNALSVANAIAAAGAADEAVLLADLRAVLEAERARPSRYPNTLAERLLDDPRWPCKANLRTRLHDMDELVGDIADQSVYVTIPNPLHPVRLRRFGEPGDRERLAAWLDAAHARPWWVRADLDAPAHFVRWIATQDGEPFAYLESYAVADDPLAAHLAVRDGDQGFHVLVGDAARLGTGAAQAAVRALLDELGAPRVVCEPDERNARMLAFCRGLGARDAGRLDLPGKRAALMEWTCAT